VKLKDYEIPQYGVADGLEQEDLSQYSLKNFDLKTFQLTQQQPDPAPIPAPCAPSLLQEETHSPGPLAAVPEAPSPNPLYQNDAPTPVQTELNQLALEPCEVHFGAHFDLQQPLYIPPSPSQSWKMPRWVVTTVGLFFGSAAVLMFAFCVVLLRDPKAPATAPVVAATPTAPVATTPAAPAPPPLADRADVRHSAPATANLMHDDSAPGRRIVVSRHPSVVRRQTYGARRVAATSASSSVEPQETETASRRPPKDALDQLLSESSL
jgi:hypothetical protein